MLACFLEHLAPILLIESSVDKLLKVLGLDISEGVFEFWVETPTEPRHLLGLCGHFVPGVSSQALELILIPENVHLALL